MTFRNCSLCWKGKGYGYKNIGFILDKGYLSKENLRFMDNNGFGFIIMVKGCKEFISEQVRKQKGTFETIGEIRLLNSEYTENSTHICVYSRHKEKICPYLL